MPKSIKSTGQVTVELSRLQLSLQAMIRQHGIFNFTRVLSNAVETIGIEESIKANRTRNDDVRRDWSAIYNQANQLATMSAVSRRSQVKQLMKTAEL